MKNHLSLFWADFKKTVMPDPSKTKGLGLGIGWGISLLIACITGVFAIGSALFFVGCLLFGQFAPALSFLSSGVVLTVLALFFYYLKEKARLKYFKGHPTKGFFD